MLRSPALHFLVLGGLLFTLLAPRGDSAESRRVPLVVPASRIELARREVAELAGRPLRPDEEHQIVERLVEEEILYRYALTLGMHREPVAERRLAQVAAFVGQNPHEAKTQQEQAADALQLGLHESDLVVRRILIDGARRLIRAVMLTREPSDEMLADYLAGHGDEFAIPARVRISHAMVNGLSHGDATEARAAALLARVRAAPSPEQAVELGDRAFVAPALPLLTEQDLIRLFGYPFARELRSAPIGTWTGPIPSRYGLHVVYVHERVEQQVPPLPLVRDAVRRRLQQKLADEWLALRLQQLRAEFEIILPERTA